jgi:hypothetical protein
VPECRQYPDILCAVVYTASQLQDLLNIRASGKLRVEMEGRSVTFQSGAALDKAIAQAKQDVAADAASAAGGRLYNRRYMEFGRG